MCKSITSSEALEAISVHHDRPPFSPFLDLEYRQDVRRTSHTTRNVTDLASNEEIPPLLPFTLFRQLF